MAAKTIYNLLENKLVKFGLDQGGTQLRIRILRKGAVFFFL